MKILTFEEYINERLFKKSIDRVKSGEKRTEELTEIDDYIKETEWVDLGHPDYLFSAHDKEFKIIDILDYKWDEKINYMDEKIHDWILDNCTFVDEDDEFEYKGENMKSVFFQNTVFDYILGLKEISENKLYFNIQSPDKKGSESVTIDKDRFGSSTEYIKLIKRK